MILARRAREPSAAMHSSMRWSQAAMSAANAVRVAAGPQDASGASSEQSLRRVSSCETSLRRRRQQVTEQLEVGVFGRR